MIDGNSTTFINFHPRENAKEQKKMNKASSFLLNPKSKTSLRKLGTQKGSCNHNEFPNLSLQTAIRYLRPIKPITFKQSNDFSSITSPLAQRIIQQ